MANESRNLEDTAVSASSGHGRYQSMVQPLMRPGNCVGVRSGGREGAG